MTACLRSWMLVSSRTCMRACVSACVRACVRACILMIVCARVLECVRE